MAQLRRDICVVSLRQKGRAGNIELMLGGYIGKRDNCAGGAALNACIS
jgi:hypothetical protein